MPPDLAELARVNASLESAHPRDIVQWAFDTFGDGLVFTASFEDAVLVDVVARVAPQADIVLLDTQYLFAETKWFADELIRRYNLNIRVVHPQPDVVPDNLWQTNVEGCCQIRATPARSTTAQQPSW